MALFRMLSQLQGYMKARDAQIMAIPRRRGSAGLSTVEVEAGI